MTDQTFAADVLVSVSEEMFFRSPIGRKSLITNLYEIKGARGQETATVRYGRNTYRAENHPLPDGPAWTIVAQLS